MDNLETKFSPIEMLSKEVCEELGILPIRISEDEIILGAMNPQMLALTEFCDSVMKKTGLNVVAKQITSEEWEKWFENTDADSLKNPIDVLSNQSRLIPNPDQSLSAVGAELDIAALPIVDEIASNHEQSIQEVVLDDLDDLEMDDIELEESEDEINTGDDDLDSSDRVVKAVANILFASETLLASDIHIEPQENNLRVRYRVDGVLKKEYEFPKFMANGISARTKILSKLDVAEKRLPQDGRMRVKFKGSDHDFRVSTLPGKFGEKIVLRALRSDNSILDLQKLVSEPNELSLIRELCDNPYGIFIVVGPTGSGKSTTLYSILSEHNDPGINISTVEDPIEYTLPGLHQVQVIREKGLDFARALRALMRQDPDVILVGETRDKETAQVAMEAALTGHMVFTTLHANDTATAITRLAEMGVPPYLVGASVVGVLAQRLMRRVCSSCSTIAKADPEDRFLQKYNVVEHHKATVTIGGAHQSEDAICSNCKGTGYKGRIGTYEVLKIDEDIRHSILSGSTSDQIRELSRKKGMRTLLEYGMELVKKGLTSLEEVERVCMLETSD